MFTSSQIFILAFYTCHSMRLSSLSTFRYTNLFEKDIEPPENAIGKSIEYHLHPVHS